MNMINIIDLFTVRGKNRQCTTRGVTNPDRKHRDRFWAEYVRWAGWLAAGFVTCDRYSAPLTLVMVLTRPQCAEKQNIGAGEAKFCPVGRDRLCCK